MSEAKTVEDAIMTRRSIRGFLDKPVDPQIIRHMLEVAKRAPSGGNLQPWKVYVLTGAAKDRLVDLVGERMASNFEGEGTEYHVYPPDLTEPYHTRRKVVGQRMYEILGVPKEDRAGKLRHFVRNYRFFDAPVAMIFTMDRQMQIGQYVDLGLFMENILLLARQYGLDTCAQEAWARWYKTIGEVLQLPGNEMVFCGLALGYADPDALINTLETDRAPLDDFVVFMDS